MGKNILLFLLFCFSMTSLFSQEKSVLMNGKVMDSIGAINNVTILNLNSKIGTFSNDNGFFEMIVHLGDSLQFSSVQHKTKVLFINKNIFITRKIAIQLTIETTVLDEFDLKRHDLSGFLGIDSKKARTNKQDSLLNKAMDFSKVNMKIVEKNDYIDERVRPPVVNTVPNSFKGVGVGLNMPFKDSEKLWALRRQLAKKKAFPSEMLAEFGENFFFTTLKIPREKYYHFLEYCNPLGIENLYINGKKLAVLKMLQEQSKSYLEIIKKE